MKTLLLQLLHSSGIARLARIWPSQHFAVINFHRISEKKTKFHDDLIELSPTEFCKQIEWLARRVDFLSEEDLYKAPKPGRPKMLLTFDDGYRDNFEIVAPILTKLGVPAIFFVAPGMIDNRSLGAWDRIAYLVKTTKQQTFRFRGKSYDIAKDRIDVLRSLSKQARVSLPEQGQLIEAELSKILECEPAPHGLMDNELMTWDQLRSLRKLGFAIGGHGLHHRPLSSLSLEDQEDEILTTKSRLEEEQLGPRSFSFPFGSSDSYSRETRELAVEAGFSFVFSFSGYANSLRKFDPTRLDRVPFKSSREKYNFLLSFPRAHNFYQTLRHWERP